MLQQNAFDRVSFYERSRLCIAAITNFTSVVQIIIHRLKNLQQWDPKTDFLSENFMKLLKRSLVFRACVVVGPFSLKLKSLTMSFESDISNDNL